MALANTRASRSGRRPSSSFEPASVATSALSKRSFQLIGTPSSGERRCPDAARAEAAALWEQAKTKQAEAVAQDASAVGLDAEVEKLGAVRAMLSAWTFRDPAGQGEGAATDQGRLEAALAQLCALPAAAWDARSAGMKAAAATARENAAALREAGEKLVVGAEAKDAAATALFITAGEGTDHRPR